MFFVTPPRQNILQPGISVNCPITASATFILVKQHKYFLRAECFYLLNNIVCCYRFCFCKVALDEYALCTVYLLITRRVARAGNAYFVSWRIAAAILLPPLLKPVSGRDACLRGCRYR